jgi:hypothetical protein
MLATSGLLGRNLVKCDELQEGKRWAAISWINRCFSIGLEFTVAEVYRSQARQDQLYKQGRRGIPGERVVTWTRTSRHTERLAMDVYPVKKLSGTQLVDFYKEIEQVAQQYGINRPQVLVAKGDLGHFELTQVTPPKTAVNPKERLKGLKRRYQTTTNTVLKPIILKEIERLSRRLGVEFP